MTGNEKLKLALEHINDIRILHADGEPFRLCVYFVPTKIRGYQFNSILEKFAKQYNAISILSYPYDVNGHERDYLNYDDPEIQNSYVIEILDGYDNLCAEIFDESPL